MEDSKITIFDYYRILKMLESNSSKLLPFLTTRRRDLL